MRVSAIVRRMQRVLLYGSGAIDHGDEFGVNPDERIRKVQSLFRRPGSDDNGGANSQDDVDTQPDVITVGDSAAAQSSPARVTAAVTVPKVPATAAVSTTGGPRTKPLTATAVKSAAPASRPEVSSVSSDAGVHTQTSQEAASVNDVLAVEAAAAAVRATAASGDGTAVDEPLSQASQASQATVPVTNGDVLDDDGSVSTATVVANDTVQVAEPAAAKLLWGRRRPAAAAATDVYTGCAQGMLCNTAPSWHTMDVLDKGNGAGGDARDNACGWGEAGALVRDGVGTASGGAVVVPVLALHYCTRVDVLKGRTAE